jgi:hypothetical protein
MKVIFRIIGFVFFALLLFGCGGQFDDLWSGEKKPQSSNLSTDQGSSADTTPASLNGGDAQSADAADTEMVLLLATPVPNPTSTPTPFLPLKIEPTPQPTPRLPRNPLQANPDTRVVQFRLPNVLLPPDVFLPDLRTLPPDDLRLVYDSGNGKKFVRFSNSIWNSGIGRLELLGQPDAASGQIVVSQLLYMQDGQVFDEKPVGEFIFHLQHNHWHLEGFALYEVWSVQEDGALDTLVSEGGKVSYCVMDIERSAAESLAPDTPRYPVYTHCWGKLQGISPNWIDVYEYHLPGQWVEITELPDGIYALVSTVDPDDLIVEMDERNNATQVYFKLEERSLQIFEFGAEEGGS